MIKHLTIGGLFNDPNNNHTFDFYPDLNLITGRNGCGKTTILKILWYAISGHYDLLVEEVEFRKIIVKTDLIEITLKKNKNTNKNDLDVRYKNTPEFDKSIKSASQIKPIIDTFHNSLFFPTFRRIEGGFSIVPKKGNFIQNNQIFESFNDLSNRLSWEGLGTKNHQFVAYVSTNDLDRKLSDELAYQSSETNRINEEFAKQVMLHRNEPEKISTLVSETQQKIHSLNIKFDVLHELVDKFLKKSVLLTDKLTIGNLSYPTPSQRLSSGEKQFFAFLCYNIFAQNSSIFIDEPEISLHPDWQRALIPLLLKQNTDNQFFITTHSDYIAATYPDKEIIIRN